MEFVANAKNSYLESTVARSKLKRIGGNISNGGTCGLIR